MLSWNSSISAMTSSVGMSPRGATHSTHHAGMDVAERNQLAGCSSAIAGVGSQGLEQSIADIATFDFVGDDEALVDQPAHQVEHRRPFDVVDARNDGLRRLERERTREDAQASERDPFGLVKPIVTPVDRGQQRLLPGDDGARPTSQQPEPVVELGGDPLGRHLPTARRRQLQRQRYAVETMADLGDSRRIRLGDLEGRPCPMGALDEQRHGFVLGQRGDVETLIGARAAHRRHAIRDLTRDAQRLAARRQDRDRRCARQHDGREFGAAFDQVLAVVEYEESGFVAEMGVEPSTSLSKNEIVPDGNVNARSALPSPVITSGHQTP